MSRVSPGRDTDSFHFRLGGVSPGLILPLGTLGHVWGRLHYHTRGPPGIKEVGQGCRSTPTRVRPAPGVV